MEQNTFHVIVVAQHWFWLVRDFYILVVFREIWHLAARTVLWYCLVSLSHKNIVLSRLVIRTVIVRVTYTEIRVVQKHVGWSLQYGTLVGGIWICLVLRQVGFPNRLDIWSKLVLDRKLLVSYSVIALFRIYIVVRHGHVFLAECERRVKASGHFVWLEYLQILP